MTLPTTTNSEYPNLHLDAFKNKLCNLNRSKLNVNVKQIFPLYFNTQYNHQYTSHIYGILIQLTQ